MSAQREQRLDSIQVQEKETLSLATGLRARAPASSNEFTQVTTKPNNRDNVAFQESG
jgi:hypothetical protein